MASQKLGSFSVPIHELMGTIKAIASAEEYVSSIPDILKSETSLILAVFLDSMCSASSLSPHKVHKSTAPRNLCIKIHCVAWALCAKKPSLSIYFAHLSSSSLPADLNSKKIDKPLDVANSEMWRRGPPEYFELGPPTNWFLRVTNEEVEWKTPQADPKILTESHFCSCSNSPDFCGQESMQMFCTTCDGDSHHCSNLHHHYQYFSSQALPKLTGIVPHDLKENSLPLPFQTYTNLLKNFCSLTKVLRVLATKCFMDNILAGMYSITPPDISLKLPQVAVLLQPGMMQTIRKFKPTEANLKDAFFKLDRSSQEHFKPSSKYFCQTRF